MLRSTHLPTAGSFTIVEIDVADFDDDPDDHNTHNDNKLHFVQGDVSDAFYHVGLPEELGTMFVLPAITAGALGFNELDGVKLEADALISPTLEVLSMILGCLLHASHFRGSCGPDGVAG